MKLPASNSLYYIQIKNDKGAAYCVQPGSGESESQLRLEEEDKSSLLQKWQFMQIDFRDPSSFAIVNAQTGYRVDARGNDTSPGNHTVVQQYAWRLGQGNQSWVLIEAEEADGKIEIASDYKRDMVWNVEENNIAEGGKIQLFNKNDSPTKDNYKFTLVPVAAEYTCNLGFDWGRDGGTDPLRLQGELIASSNNNSPALFTQLQTEATINFILYDITEINSPTKEPVDTPNLTMKMDFFDLAKDPPTAATPLTPLPGSGTQYQVTKDGALTEHIYSVAFGELLPAYEIQKYTVSLAGVFSIKITIEVTKGDVTKTYVFDPEMIIGSSS